MKAWIVAAGILLAGASLAADSECPAAAPAVRVMLHEPELLAARLAVVTDAPDSHSGRLTAARKLFAAAGCARVEERGKGERRNLECVVPGASAETIVVGVSQRYDSVGSVALVPSLMEAVSAAPRKHTFRWVAFSAHEGRTGKLEVGPRPRGAMRLLDALTPKQRSEVALMLHVGPIGFGSAETHPDVRSPSLDCAFSAAARAAGLQVVDSRASATECYQGGTAPSSTNRDYLTCQPDRDWRGGADWQPFERVGLQVFGVHSRPGERALSGEIDGAAYVRSYRALAIFLALADEALASPASSGATSSR